MEETQTDPPPPGNLHWIGEKMSIFQTLKCKFAILFLPSPTL